MVVIYQAYGSESILRQTLFSAVSALKCDPNQDFSFCIYTDRPDFFQKFFGSTVSVNIVHMDQSQIRQWKGAIDFLHRVKIEMLIDVTKRFSGPYLYCDGDTCFKVAPSMLAPMLTRQQTMMHVAECQLDEPVDPLTKKIAKFARKNSFSIRDQTVTIPSSTVMWNAGVLGFSKDFAPVLNDVLALTDQMYSLYPKHVMEQLAFSYFFQTRSQILAADKFIDHYWDKKEYFQAELDAFFMQHPTAAEALKHYTLPDWSRYKSNIRKNKTLKDFFRFFTTSTP